MAFVSEQKDLDVRYAEHTVTVYTKLQEDANGVGQWRRTIVTHCTLFKRQGVHTLLTRTMEVPFDKATLYFFIDTAEATNQWLPEHEFRKLADTTGYFTVHSDGRDRIIEGEWTENSPPGDNNPLLFKPNIVVDNSRMGSRDMQHIRIVMG